MGPIFFCYFYYVAMVDPIPIVDPKSMLYPIPTVDPTPKVDAWWTPHLMVDTTFIVLIPFSVHSGPHCLHTLFPLPLPSP